MHPRLSALLLGFVAARSSAQLRYSPVETLMRRVDFHVDSTLIMHIAGLRGRLVPRRANAPPSFDDPQSFDLEIDTATISLSTSSLADLLNRYVFAFPGTPLRALKIETEGERLKQSGRLHGLHFSVLSDVAVTPAGELVLHPVSIHVLGIGARGIMRLFGLSLQKLANVKQAPGVRIVGNDLLLTPAAMLPAPRTRGKLVAAVVHDSSVTLRFRQGVPPARFEVPDSGLSGFMYFRGGTLRFWTLTMMPADLLVVDHDRSDPFDFWLARYRVQLLAGFSRNTAEGGLVTEWPDFNDRLRSTPSGGRPR